MMARCSSGWQPGPFCGRAGGDAGAAEISPLPWLLLLWHQYPARHPDWPHFSQPEPETWARSARKKFVTSWKHSQARRDMYRVGVHQTEQAVTNFSLLAVVVTFRRSLECVAEPLVCSV